MSDQRKANAANSSNSSISNNNKLEDPGVYMNCRLMHSFTSLIGATVEVELMGGERYEGIFKTFSPKCDLVLCSVAQIINDDESEKRSSALGSNVGNLVACLEKNIKIEDQVVFDQASLIKFRANNIDLDFATMPKKTVLTDGEISGVDGKKMQEKELVPWDDGGECDYNALEESSNGIQNGGWDSSEMFDYNERNYNINSTYNDDMSGYTIKLEQREDPDFVQRKIHAEKIAREIEKDPKRQSRLAKENDLDEETRFSAVVADRKGQRNGPNNAMPINNSNNNNSNNNSMTRGSPRNEMSHSGRDGRDGQRRESMRSNRGDPGRDSRERDFSRQNSRQGGSGGGGPSGGGGRGRDMDRRIDNRGVGGGGGGDVRNDGRNDGRIDGRNDGRNDGRGGDRGGDGRGDRGRGNDRRISGGINEANWRTDNRRSVNDRRKMDEPQLQPQQQQQQPKKADQRPSQTPPPPQTPGTPSSSISDAGTTKSDSSAFSKKDTSPKAGVTAASVVALSVAPQPNNSPSLVPQTTLTASDSPVSGAYSKKESSPMAGAAAPVALGGGGGGTNVPSSPAGAAPPSGAPPSAVTTPVSASSSSSSLPTPSSASSSQSTGSGEIKSNLNPNAKAFTPRANPSPAAMQQQYMLAASQQHQQQQQQQAQQQQQQQQAMVNFSYQSQHMVTSPPSTMPNQYIQISPHPSHLPPQSIHHHLPPHQQQGHPHQQPGHPHQQPGHPHQQQPHPHQHQAHPHQPQGQPHQQQGPHPQMGPGGPYMQFPPYNLPIPQMLPNGAQYITIPNVPTMPNAMPHGGLYTGPVPGVPTQAGPGQPTGPNPAGGPGGYPCNVFFHHNVSLPGPMPGIGGPKQ